MTRRLVPLGVVLLGLAGGAGSVLAEVKIEDADILSVNRKMAHFLVEHVKPNQVRRIRLQGLMEAIFSEKGLGMEYGNTRTRTAAETFEARSGNCLSFTLLFVAMARHLGLNAYFREVDEMTSWDVRGDLLVRNRHMFAEVELDNGFVRVDFLPGTDKNYHYHRRVGDRRVLAHFYNNLGAEELAAGEVERAVAYFEKALSTDEEFVPALVNLGAAYRRQDRFDDAEATLLRAMKLDSSEMASVSNLASLYLALGRTAEAEPLTKRVQGEMRRNPYHHFRLGRTAAGAGLLDEAIVHYEEAIARLPGEPRFYADLAEVELRVGAVEEGRASLRRAIELADDPALRRNLSARLAAVEAGRL